MRHLLDLLEIACGRPIPESARGKATRVRTVLAAVLASAALAAIWGAAAGASSVSLAAANVVKVPLVLLLSAASAVPAGLLAWKLSGADCRATDLLLSFSSGLLCGALALAVLSPLVALYYHSTTWAGPVLGIGSVFVALATGVVVFIRAALRTTQPGARRWLLVAPIAALLLVNLSTLPQFIALASPILPERTIFADGIESLASVAPRGTAR